MTTIFFLHGGGNSSKARYRRLIERFDSDGVSAFAFTHHGHSLSERLQESEHELEQLKTRSHLGDNDIFLWGSSMGGHVAARLVANHPRLRGLILQSAAAYAQAAEIIPFGPHFTAAITLPHSWQDSLAFTSLSQYQGPVLVIYGAHDDVIPREVVDAYRLRAQQNGAFYLLNNAKHSLLRPTTDSEHLAWETMYRHALSFVRSRHHTSQWCTEEGEEGMVVDEGGDEAKGNKKEKSSITNSYGTQKMTDR